MVLPPRRKPKPSGIERGPRREWPRHRKWLRGFACCVPGCIDRDTEVAHIRSAANAGTGLKPADWSALPYCRAHHAESHRIGQDSFDSKYRLDSAALARQFAAQSPDKDMREAMKDADQR